MDYTWGRELCQHRDTSISWFSQEPELSAFVHGIHGLDGDVSVFSREIRDIRVIRVQKRILSSFLENAILEDGRRLTLMFLPATLIL